MFFLLTDLKTSCIKQYVHNYITYRNVMYLSINKGGGGNKAVMTKEMSLDGNDSTGTNEKDQKKL